MCVPLTPQKVMVWLMYVTTFCFCLTWQFNQFILLVQALIIYTLDCADFITTTQVWLQQGKGTFICVAHLNNKTIQYKSNKCQNKKTFNMIKSVALEIKLE